MAKENTFMEEKCEDTYFLDRDLAYITALSHNTVTLDDGQLMPQVCYYDGEPFEFAPDNLINVPAEHFAEFFANHQTRMPKQIDTTTQTTAPNGNNLLERFQGMMSLARKTQLDSQ